jgi:hypothetical protein
LMSFVLSRASSRALLIIAISTPESSGAMAVECS